MPTRPRIRIRYRKQDELRWIGHQDLVRTWERLLRRAEVRPAQTEGFHKRPRMNFPSALPVGISGNEEVMELELSVDTEPAEVRAALMAHVPPGLSIECIERMPEGAKFSHPSIAEYEVPLPDDLLPEVAARLARRRDAGEEFAPSVESVELCGAVLHMRLKLGEAGAVRPRDLLALLDLGDLESRGAVIVRTHVEVAG